MRSHTCLMGRVVEEKWYTVCGKCVWGSVAIIKNIDCFRFFFIKKKFFIYYKDLKGKIQRSATYNSLGK